MHADLFPVAPIWHLLTRLGEIQILLPMAALVFCRLPGHPQGSQQALRWFASVILASVLTTVSKVAFIGWGMGIAWLNFTGVSGHSMFSASVYPMLAYAISGGLTRRQRWVACGCGFVLALVVSVSRVVVGAHSPSEAVVGFALGGSVSLYALRCNAPAPRPTPLIYPVLVALWLTQSPVRTPVVETHPWVSRLALALSSRHAPYTRRDMLVSAARSRAAIERRQRAAGPAD